MTSIVNWGILGTGKVAREVASCFPYANGANLLAVGSRTKESAQSFANTFEIPNVYGSYEAILSDDKIDIVYIATPHHRHREDCLRSFSQGKSVMCEKPFARTFKEAQEIADEARKKGLFCMEAMWSRFFPLIKEVKTLIDKGTIGELVGMTADFGYPTPYDPSNRFFNLDLGGGALLDRGVYLLNLANYIIGKHDSVQAIADIGKTKVDETSNYLLHYPSGASANLSATLISYGYNEAMIYGRMGSIRIHAPFFKPEKVTIFRTPLNYNPSHFPGPMPRLGKIGQRLRRQWIPVNDKLKGGEILSRPHPGAGYQYEIDEATRCIAAGINESDILPLNDTLYVMKVMDNIRNQLGLSFA